MVGFRQAKSHESTSVKQYELFSISEDLYDINPNILIMKKSQAAMEFMLTYGWAMMVGAVVIVGMSYFGLFDLDTYLPSKCDFPVGLTCKDFSVLDTSVDFSIMNNLGGKIDTIQITVPSCAPGNIAQIENGETTSLSIPCVIPVGKFNYDISISYTKSSTGLTFDVIGTISGKKR